MYVDLVNQDGDSELDQVVPIDNGAADGAIDLPGSLEPGNYMLRAFTDFQKQIGEDAFYYKQVMISKLESFVEGPEQPEGVVAQDIDVAFLPEGGMLLEGHLNTIGVEAIDSFGQGVSVQGAIHNSIGKTAAVFTTGYRGMTSVRFVSDKGESYQASLVAYPDFSYTFSDIVEEGIKIEFERESDDGLHFKVVSNAESLMNRIYYFAIMHHGEEIFYKKFVPKTNALPIRVNKDALPAGINRLVVLDEQLRPVSERLFFSTDYQINEIKIKADKRSYKTRSSVRLRLADGKELDSQSWSNLSMVVVDEFAINKEDPESNILTCLLLDSELRGHIESPGDYFVDDQEMASVAKLDLLMMTQGWSRYIWSEPEEYMALEASEEEGFSISGTVNRVIGKKPATEGTVDLKIYSNDFMHMDEVELDQDGRFRFKDVSFIDSASVFIQARNKRDKLAYEPSLDPIFEESPGISADYFPQEEAFEYKQAEIYQKQYDNLQALKEYTLKTGGIFLDEVTIKDYRREPEDGHFRIYAKPENSQQISERDITYLNVIDYMQGRFAGVMVGKDYKISIRGPSGFGPRPPLLLLDGTPVNEEVYLSIPMNDIDRVEVLKNPAETAIFGTRGGSGVVSVFTKKGGITDYSDMYIPGTIAEKLAGYSSNREFYSPAYTRDNIEAERPDHRIVLYWSPNIFIEKGVAIVNFYTSDDLSRYSIYVEGITSDGTICLGSSKIEVDKRH